MPNIHAVDLKLAELYTFLSVLRENHQCYEFHFLSIILYISRKNLEVPNLEIIPAVCSQKKRKTLSSLMNNDRYCLAEIILQHPFWLVPHLDWNRCLYLFSPPVEDMSKNVVNMRFYSLLVTKRRYFGSLSITTWYNTFC